ncbi:MAG TPA: M1 family metallopeptidase, partial [Myxococcaceae bacterium]|nr:M1 family metallopeptidase [Myxococcaceae bacterium]
MQPLSERVALTVAPDREDFDGEVEISLSLSSPRQDLWVSAAELGFRKALLRTSAGEFPARVELDPARSAAHVSWSGPEVSGRATLVLGFTGRFDPRLVGLYHLRTRSGWAAYTQFEFIDARRAFPCFDEPGFKIPWDLELTIPVAHIAAANTLPVEEVQVDAGLKRVRFGTTRPLPSYLVAFVVGDFDVVSAAPLPADAFRSRALPIRAIAPRQRGAELAYGLKSGIALLQGLERWLGIPYPYEKLDHVAVPDFAFGAMENAGLITYAESLLLLREGQASEDERLSVARVMTHEMAHHWFGDLVTPRWWDDLWLNESFAAFMEAEVVGPWNPALGAEIDRVEEAHFAMRNDELEGSRPIRPVLRTEADLRAWDPPSIYAKGAGVMAMFQNLLGRDVFRRRMAQYLEAHRDRSATTDDLVTALAGPGQDIGPALLGFVDQPGVPLVRGELRCDGAGARIAVHQERALPRGSTAPQVRWQVPVCARTEGDRQPRCTLLTGADGAIALPGRCPRWVHLNAGANGYYRWLLPASGMDAVLRKGWEALAPAERLSAGDALLSSAVDGAIPAAEALARIGPLAREREPAVPERTMRFLAGARFNWASPGTDPALQRFMREQFRPVLARLGWTPHRGESARTRRLRSDVIKLLAIEAADPEVLARAAGLGRAWIGDDGRVHPEAVDPDLRDVVVRAAARAGGKADYDTMELRLNGSDDATVRRALAAGLGSFLQPELAERARTLSISPSLRLWDRFAILFPQAYAPELRNGLRDWLVAHQEQLAGLMAEADKQIIASLVTGCSTEEAARVSTDFAPLARSAASLPFQLRKAEERVRLCGAAR